jgi:hypothetical protein
MSASGFCWNWNYGHYDKQKRYYHNHDIYKVYHNHCGTAK